MKKIPQKFDKKNDEDSSQRLLRIQNMFIVSIKLRMSVFFDSLKGILFVFEQNSESDYKQSLNYVALNKVLDNNQNIQKKFFESINSAFRYFQQTEYNFFINENLHTSSAQNNKTTSKEDELKIISMLINKIENACENQLNHLETIFSGFTDNKKLSINQLPVSPFVLLSSLIASIEGMDLNAGIRMIIYNAFDINVLLKLENIYKEILDKNSITGFEKPKAVAISKNNKLQDKKYLIIEKIFNRQHKLKNQSDKEGNIISKDLIIQSLNIIQEKVLNKYKSSPHYHIEPIKLKKLLTASIAKLDQNSAFMSYSKNDENMIQLVKLLFTYIDKDSGIRNALKLLLQRLQITVLKISLQNNEIFKDYSNPVRQLLNKMSYIPDGFSDELNSNHKYILQLNQVVSSVVKQSTYNKVFYQKTLDGLNQFIEKTNKRFDLIQKRIKEKEVGLEKISRVKTKVTQILEKKMHKRHMPIFVRDLLLETWSNVLVLEHLRHPAESRACLSKVEFIDLLLNNIVINKGEKISSDKINEILEKYGEGLDLVAFNSKDLRDKKNEMLKFLSKKQALEKKVNDEEKSVQEHLQYELILYKKSEINSQTNEGIKPHKKDYYYDMVKLLKVGTWLEFVNEEKKKMRVKISWVSPITNNFLLVSSNGIRLADKSPEEIAAGFRDGTCTELQIIPLFDRALLHIAKELNESLK